jgi:hypothetical protein
MKKIIIFIIFLCSNNSFANQDKDKLFRKIAINSDYYLLIMKISEGACEQYNKSKCSPEMRAHLNKVLRKNMQDSFNKQFTQKEIEYLDSVFKNPLMDRVYKFRREYHSNPELYKLIQSEIKNFKNMPAKVEPKPKLEPETKGKPAQPNLKK